MSRLDASQSIELIYAAITRPELWSDVVESLVRNTGSNSGILCVEKPDHSAVLAYSDYGFDESAMNAYADHFVSTDLWVEGMYARAINHFHLSHEVTPQKTYLSSEMYNDWGKYQDMHFATGVYVDSPQDVALRLCLQRSNAEGAYTREEQALLNSVAPHLRRAITVHDDLVSMQLIDSSATRILDQMPFAAFLVDDKCRIEFRNAGCDAVLACPEAFSDAGNILSIDGRQAEFCRLVHGCCDALSGGRANAGGTLLLRSRTGDPLYEVSISPLVVDDFRLCFQYQRLLALVMVRDVQVGRRLSEAVLALYELSAAERQVAQLLCAGLSAARIASELERSFHTVRTHIRNVLQKTGSTSQAEAVAKLLSGTSAPNKTMQGG